MKTILGRHAGARALAVAAAVAALSMPYSPAQAGTLDAQYTETPVASFAGYSGWAAQTFTAGSTGLVDTVDVSIEGCSDIVGAIHAVGGSGAPTSLLATSAPSTCSGGYAVMTFAAPALVTAGQQYAIVIPGTSFWRGVAPGTYSGGTGWWNDSDHWYNAMMGSDYQEIDFLFRTYVAPAPALTITASSGSGGSISPSGAVSVDYAGSQTFTMAPDPGYHVSEVLVDGTALATPVTSYTFSSVTASHTIAASFAINTYTITASSGVGGSISPSGAVSVEHNSSQAFTITPDLGYHVTEVLVDGTALATPVTSYTFSSVTASHTIAASFANDYYTITARAGVNGTISDKGAVQVIPGSDRTYSITPDPGYHVADVVVDGVSQGSVTQYTFTDVTANHLIKATFAINTFEITASAGPNGTISPSGIRTVKYGSKLTFRLTPDRGYVVDVITVDGQPLAASVSRYTFSAVDANHTIHVTFK